MWIFQAHRPLTAAETALANESLRQFTDAWTVHGSPLNTSYEIRFNQFIILGADESNMPASGCSIDSSVRALKEIGQALNVDLFDRDQVAFNLKGQVRMIPVGKLKEKFSDGTLNADSLTFNNLITNKSELDERWLAAASDTWLKRYLAAGFVKVK
jgi:hypothetical protein